MKTKEDDALIEVFKDLVNGGTSFKTDNGFKPEKLKAKLTESNLKAQPHVHSQLRQFKSIYNVVHDMLHKWIWIGPRNKVSSGPERSLESLCEGKPCPYYEDLCIIFGKDHTSGKDAQGPEEMEDEVNEEGENEESSKRDEPKSSSPQEHSGVEVSSGKSRNLGKRVRVSDNLVKGLSEVASILGREINAASSNISQAIGFDVKLNEKHSKLNEELANFSLITMERHQAARKITSESKSVYVFFSIPDTERKEWVEALLRGDI
ncbi:hypothetical protein Cgig2_008924 [Carnegiea gigantea]|uniref:Myb/SANT-like domain-containing protein n=1 Tax=Carnegiea gigantea TaxID=171969 RepID=A0A9Q1JI60_9CARY|nr:hypothetical protein Cgig2_008924 [Carnegiea gigantea]